MTYNDNWLNIFIKSNCITAQNGTGSAMSNDYRTAILMAILTHNGTKSHNTQVMWQWLMISKSLDFSQLFFLSQVESKNAKALQKSQTFYLRTTLTYMTHT